MAAFRFASHVAVLGLACCVHAASASTCVQPSEGAQVVPTGDFPITPRQTGGTMENPLRRGTIEPLLMLTFGDSAMWGNGLTFDYKFANKVAQDMADGTGRAVRLVTYSHSAANISKQTGVKYVPLRKSDKGIPRGDLNAGLPTTLQQEGCAAQPGSHADFHNAELVILNGCINDVSAEGIALPFPLGGLSVDEIKRRTHKWCSDTMLELLENTKRDFPYATIVVANYWRIVSESSSPVGKAMQRGADKDATREEKRVYDEMNRLLKKQLEAERMAGQLKTDAAIDKKKTFQKWGDGSKTFLEASTQCFNWAIATANGTNSALNGTDSCPEVDAGPLSPATSDARVYLAKISDDPNHSYGAPDKWIWSVPVSPNPHDLTYDARQKLCRSHYKLDGIANRFICRVNPTAHPNEKGAEAYRESITSIMKIAWPKREGGLKSEVQHLDP